MAQLFFFPILNLQQCLDMIKVLFWKNHKKNHKKLQKISKNFNKKSGIDQLLSLKRGFSN
jgi:hypothetical protein